MNFSPEIKAQLEEQKKQCVFCKIASKEIDSKIVFEDESCLAVLDIYPAIKGHTVLLLKEHYPILPYIPPDEFKHCFGLMPQLSGAVKKAFISTGINVFIANGGVAGQRSAHLLIHLFPREEGDKFFNFLWNGKSSLDENKLKILEKNFPLIMQKHFQQNPESWHQGKGERPSFLQTTVSKGKIIYEDEKVLCLVANKGIAAGQIEIYSKQEEKYIEKLSAEDSAQLFFTASLAATLVFEGLGAQGTNLILKSGMADDNSEGNLGVYVLPRMQDDNLHSLLWEPKPPGYDLNDIQAKIKDKTWNVKFKSEDLKI